MSGIEIRVKPCALGNQMFRIMFAGHLKARLPDSSVTGFNIPEFGLVGEQGRPSPELLTITPIAGRF